MERKTQVCSEDHSVYLDNFVRKILHNPQKMFHKYIKAGDTVMDIGCGPGTFTIDLAKMVTKQGRVIGIDLQEGMIKRATQKARRNGVLDIITFHQCQSN
ncbi:MAG: methyltransferase domain-containing protein, partial [Chitinispirillia bacterium]